MGDTVAAVSSVARQSIVDEADVTADHDEPEGPDERTGDAGDDRSTGTTAGGPAGNVVGGLDGIAAGAWTRWSVAMAGAGRRFARWCRTPNAVDVWVCLLFAAFGFWLTRGLWPDPATRAIADNVNDQALIEWFLAHGVLVWQGDFSFVTDRLNAPDGVNLMSNASHILHGVIMAPVTATLGAAVSFALLVALNLAATAAGWYLLLARTLGLSRGAALVGGAVAGFAPGMISQSNSHLHMTAQWLVPPIIYCLVRLTRVRGVRQLITTSIGLAALICAQLLLGEEVLFLTALSLVLFILVYAACRPRWAVRVAPRFLAGTLLAAGISGIVLAYPLWVQFQGPQHTPNAPFGPEYFYADLASFVAFSPLSAAGSPDAGRLATSSAEYNTYLGLPLILVVVACLVYRWRSPVTAAAGVTGVVMTLLSFGPYVTLGGERTGLPSLYSRLARVPVINGALPTRYALALIPIIAVLLAYAVDAGRRSGTAARFAVPIVVAAALLPIAPKPLQTTDRVAVPEFISTGAWRQCAPRGGVLVPVPLPTPAQPDLMRWPAAAQAQFAIPEGFFIGPYGPGGRSSIGVYPRPTSRLLADVARTGNIPAVTDDMRRQAHQDLAYWHADCVALAHVPQEVALRTTLDQLLGPGTAIVDTWTWKTR
jgi:hypothetical protein